MSDSEDYSDTEVSDNESSTHIAYGDLTKICARCKKEHSHRNFKILKGNELTKYCRFCLSYARVTQTIETLSAHQLSAMMSAIVSGPHGIPRKRQYEHSYEIRGMTLSVELIRNEIEAMKYKYRVLEARLKKLEEIEENKKQMLAKTQKCKRCTHEYNMTEFKEKLLNGVKTGKYTTTCNKCLSKLKKSTIVAKSLLDTDVQFKEFFDDIVISVMDDEGDGSGKTYENSDIAYKLEKFDFIINKHLAYILTLRKKKCDEETFKIEKQKMIENRDKLILFRDALQKSIQPVGDKIKCSKCHHELPLDKYVLRKNGTYTKMCDNCREITRKK